MPLDVQIHDKTVELLNDNAKAVLKTSVAKYAEDVLQEAGRYERNWRSAEGDPEITSSMIHDANTVLRRGFVKPPKSALVLIAVGVTNLLALVAGFLIQFYQEPWAFIAIMSCAVIVAVLEVIQYQRG